MLERKNSEDSIRAEFEQSFDDRVNRYLALRPHGIIPNKYFAAVSSECFYLYRDGHFYGCISLAQSVGEAIVRFLSEKHGWNPEKNDYTKNVAKLKSGSHISESIFSALKKLWTKRNTYHHLNADIEADREKLEELAKKKLSQLKIVETDIFGHTVNNGAIVPNNPHYWDLNPDGKTMPIFLRLD